MKPRIRVQARSVAVPARPRASLETAQPYDAGDVLSSNLSAWAPFRDHPDNEIGWGRDAVTARARDLVRNNGYAAGGVRREVESVIGASFRPSARPDWRALGIDRATAIEIGQQMDAAWREWADDPRCLCDVTRVHGFSGLAGLAYLSYLLDGDGIGVLHWEDTSWDWRTRLRVVDPDLLEQPWNVPDRRDLRGGIELDAHGAARAYHFRRDHPLALYPGAEFSWDRVERETPWGRPVVAHFFDKQRDGQTRGISRLATVIESLKMGDKYSRVELQAAVLGAILGLYVSSPLGPEVVRDMIDDGKFVALDDARRALIGENGLTFGGVRIPVLPPGDTIESVSVNRPGNQFEAFSRSVLRNIAAGLGTSYEQLAMDYSQTNYSSMRAALLEVWRGWTARRIAFGQRWCGSVRFAVMEEAFDTGRVTLPAGAPDFYEAPGAWLRCKWIGPGRGFVDPVKEVQGAALRVAGGFSTMEDEAAELSGSDYAENLAQIRREIDEMPEGVLHPAQERFAELLGPAAAGAPTDGEAANRRTQEGQP